MNDHGFGNAHDSRYDTHENQPARHAKDTGDKGCDKSGYKNQACNFHGLFYQTHNGGVKNYKSTRDLYAAEGL